MLSIHLAVFLFGLAGLFGKLLTCSPAVIVFGRTAFAAIALIPFARGSMSWRERGVLVLLGGLLAAHWTSFFYSIQVSTVAIGLLGFATFPVFVTFLEPLGTGTHLRARDVALAIVVFVGLTLVVPAWTLSDHFTAGALWGTLSGLTFAGLTILNRRLVQRQSALVITQHETAAAALLLLPWAAPQLSAVSLSDWAWLAVLGVLCTALAHTIFVTGLSHVKARVASVIASLEPVYGILLSIPLLHEVPSGRTLVGGCVIVMATVYTSLQRQSTSSSTPN